MNTRLLPTWMADEGRLSRPTRPQRRERTLLTLEEQLSCVIWPAKTSLGPETVGGEGAVCVWVEGELWVCVCVCVEEELKYCSCPWQGCALTASLPNKRQFVYRIEIEDWRCYHSTTFHAHTGCPVRHYSVQDYTKHLPCVENSPWNKNWDVPIALTDATRTSYKALGIRSVNITMVTWLGILLSITSLSEVQSLSRSLYCMRYSSTWPPGNTHGN